MLESLKRADGIEPVLAAIDRDGGAIVVDFLAPELLERLNRELDAHVEAQRPGSASESPLWQVFHGRNTKRLCGLAARSPAFVDVMLDPLLGAYADHALLPNCGGYWLNTSQMMVIGPGEPAQFPHRDLGNWPHFPWPSFELTTSAMVALGEFTEANGATLIAPGSHLWDDPARQATEAEILQAAMPAGAALFYSGKVIHGAGENRTTDAWRRGMHVSFVLGWLRPEENHYLAVPLEVARELPERARELLGYTTYQPTAMGGRLGLVDFDEAERVVTGRTRTGPA